MEPIVIYTDGSCTPNPGRGGWAYAIIHPPLVIQGSGYEEKTTNNRMELTAVIQGLLHAIDLFDSSYIIYVDSEYVVKVLTSQKVPKKNQDLWKQYKKISRNKKMAFHWIKAHDGNRYNEMVDKLAKHAGLSKHFQTYG